MKEQLDAVFDADKRLEGAILDLHTLAKAMDILGFSAGDTLREIADGIETNVGVLKDSFFAMFHGRCADTTQATANMVSAALAVATMKSEEKG